MKLSILVWVCADLGFQSQHRKQAARHLDVAVSFAP